MAHKYKLFGKDLEEAEHSQPFTRYGAATFYNKVVTLITDAAILLAILMICCTAVIYYAPEIRSNIEMLDKF